MSMDNQNTMLLFEESELLSLLNSDNITDDETRQFCRALEAKEMTDDRLGFCGYVWDEVLCWPPSPPGTTAVHACMEEFRNVHYDSSKNATKNCLPDGTWANYTDYYPCFETAGDLLHTNFSGVGILPGTEITTWIYVFGYSTSLLILCAAVWIFIYFKDLRCLRNTIHINLMGTYILADAMWLLYAGVQMHIYNETASCIFFVFFLHYFHLTNFFWMFVEGLYLYMLVVETFTRENIKLRTYLAIGWGAPFIIMVAWTITRWLTSNVPSASGDPLEPPQDSRSCSWMSDGSMVDWIFNASALLVLAVNLLFLIMIMWVLITKLRSSNNVETQQYRKATKALIVLIPLLGLTYIFFVLVPIEGAWARGVHYVRAVLLSTQGFTVALLYCFLNTEVQNTVRHHFSRWKESRDIGHRRFTYSKDWSPNTRTESIRLCSKHEVAPYKKRESTVSESTTLTLVGYGGGSRLSNGSSVPSTVAIRAPVSPFLEPPREKAV